MRKITSALFIALLALSLSACTGPRLLNSLTANPDRETMVSRDITYGEHPRQKIDIYRPSKPGPHPVLVYYHGGGWERGNKDEYAFVGKRFAAEGYLTAMVNYRLTPEGAYPVFMQDSATAFAQVLKLAPSYDGNGQVYVAGHSAGAYIAVMLAAAPEFLLEQNISPGVLDGAVGISGPYDFLPLDTLASKSAFGGAPDLPATQPVNLIHDETPPILLLHGQKDKVVRERNVTAMEAALKQKGKPVSVIYYPEADHADTVIAIAWPRRLPVVADMIQFFEAIEAQAD